MAIKQTIGSVPLDLIATHSLAVGTSWRFQNTGNTRIYFENRSATSTRADLTGAFILDPAQWSEWKVGQNDKLYFYCEEMDEVGRLTFDEQET